MNFDVKPEMSEKLKQEPGPLEDPDDNVSLQMSESSNGEVINPNSTTLESENITTLICADYLADEVSRVVGLCSSKWGFLEQECTFLLVERLQRYFGGGGDRKLDSIDYHWLSRVLRGLWSVGEFAFREMIPYLEKIDPEHVPEFVYPYFNVSCLERISCSLSFIFRSLPYLSLFFYRTPGCFLVVKAISFSTNTCTRSVEMDSCHSCFNMNVSIFPLHEMPTYSNPNLFHQQNILKANTRNSIVSATKPTRARIATKSPQKCCSTSIPNPAT